MEPYVFILLICVISFTILAVCALRYLAVTRQAQARIANDEAYRAIAEKALAAQLEHNSTFVASLSAIQASLAEVQRRQASIEHILKAVE
jgi:Tfp pilus assembly protein PilO